MADQSTLDQTAPAAPAKRSRRRKLLIGLAVVLAVFAGAVWATYPGIGRLTYATTIGIEARLNGLHTEHAEVGGLTMAYYEGGEKTNPTIVMVHGFTADRDVWIRFADRFVDKYHVVIPDLAGHGDTGDAQDYTPKAQAERIAGLLDKLDVEKTHIIGNSMGGHISAQFALDFPQRTLSLGLVDAAGVTPPKPSEFETLVQAGKNPFLFTDPAKFDALYDITMTKPPFVPGFVKDALTEGYVQRQDEYTKIFGQIYPKPWLDDRIAGITVPTLIMWGAKDQLLDVSAAHVYADGIKESKLVIYDDLGHMPMLEDPERSSKDYADFLG